VACPIKHLCSPNSAPRVIYVLTAAAGGAEVHIVVIYAKVMRGNK